MADNLKVGLTGAYSEQSDYSDPEWEINWDEYEIDPTEAEINTFVAAVAGSTYALSVHYTAGTAALMAIKNTDGTNYVQAGWTDISGTACVARIPAGGLLVIPAVNPTAALVLTADTAAVKCKVLIAQ